MAAGQPLSLAAARTTPSARHRAVGLPLAWAVGAVAVAGAGFLGDPWLRYVRRMEGPFDHPFGTVAGLVGPTQDTKRIAGPGGIGSTVETSCSWRDAAGQTIAFHRRRPCPPGPGGPMVAAREIRGTRAGAPATFVETSVFQGAPARVTAAFRPAEADGSRAAVSRPRCYARTANHRGFR